MEKSAALSTSVDQLQPLVHRLKGHSGFSTVVDALLAGGRASLDGVWGSARALLAAALSDAGEKTLLVICPKPEQAEALFDELENFSDVPRFLLPAWETEPGERILYDEIYGGRLRVLKWLAEKPSTGIIVSSIPALMQPISDVSQLEAHTRRIVVGEKLDPSALRSWLVEQGFHPTSAVELPGESSGRGGIVDVFAPDWDNPVRIEFFGDEIESIRGFEVATQRSIGSLEAAEITLFEPNDPGESFVTDHLPQDAWIVSIEPTEIEKEAKHYHELLEHPEFVHGHRKVTARFESFAQLSAEAIAHNPMQVRARLPFESVERFSGEISKVRDELEAIGADHDVFVVCHNEAEAKRLDELFAETELAKNKRLHFPLGTLHEGFRLTQDNVVVVGGAQLFSRTDLTRKAKRHVGRAIDSFLDLREGELVVHLAHGIGRYRGLELLDRENQSEEHLAIEFAGGTKIFVPASRIALVQKYVGGTKGRPRLAKVGGKAWSKQKLSVEQAVNDMAVEMLELQANRMSRPGIAFNSDSLWQQEFDASFPYRETEDQITAISTIKSDMIQGRPMDRLLCGDVGFGKTEVAMRAAFKAVDNGYQVAVLVPTTILAAQHWHTFRQRMAEFPFEIGVLSRFSTRSEQNETIKRVADGSVDIIIGTHRLAQKDVTFANLGLVVIDEEQRFGVEIKERLKTYRETVDILTMTATPIPRTLHMAMLGARDISNLHSAPADRIAVETRVTRFDEDLIRHAVMRELNRDGQIYFVHNRIHDIELLADKLRRIVPEATIEIGHGQMPEGKLEEVMTDFVNHRFDLLLATTIVESGLDIAAANTIFIDDANRYGLADLHQLRGRVGRYKHRAYCYLLIDPDKSITPNAAKRMRAIEEYSEIGAGFAISMRDLEIRGAGNILGTQQSGHIATVGYELYCQLVEGAVRKLKRQPPRRTLDVDIDLPGEAYFPRHYVSDMRAKLDIYRRLGRVESYDDVEEIENELVDRFGALPPPAARMLALARLRLDVSFWAIHTVGIEGQGVRFGFGDRQRIDTLERESRRKVRVVDEVSAYLSIGKGVSNPDYVLKMIKSVLRAD